MIGIDNISGRATGSPVHKLEYLGKFMQTAIFLFTSVL